ncbi:beta-lactamase [Knoellia sinensis KCTC 19936]|uniref:Beta-lactamase n=1 Tax=Knoellia sinensis KCTC 19936 TaxID=1385520 RepID=A0A0A0J3U0_9MICO|nr:serine hydrolase domain-containing protein [Knoellia sinensis]KGN30301.1 beta-lactamase [Knoellia sinensis KCTC 19936]
MTLSRRVVLGGGIAAGTTLFVPALAARADDFDKPFTGFAPPSTVLREGTPASVGLDPAPIEAAKGQLLAHQDGPAGGRPMYAGHVGLMAHDGVVVATQTGGYAVRYRTATEELPEADRVPMRRDTIFDLASVSKLFTSIAVVQLIEEGRVQLEAAVADYLPEFASAGKSGVTIRHLLTHTSGFTAWLPLYSRYPDKESRIAAVMNQPLTNQEGTVYRYSDLNLIALGVLVERLRGQSLDEVVSSRLTEPLGMIDTGYNPAARERTAATEYQAVPARGMVRGEVHDENAWSLDGVAGHAGVFSTADDLAVLAQALLNGGTYRGARVLDRKSVALLITNFTEDFPGDDHGLGFELNQTWYMDALSGPRTAGHTGYTGTSLVIDFQSRSFATLLTNRVHPSRSWGSNNPARRDWAGGLGRALPITPRGSHVAWETEARHASNAILAVPLAVPGAGARLGFDLVAETEATDVLRVETSPDGVVWTLVPLDIRHPGDTREGADDGSVSGTPGERRWALVRAELPAATRHLRWRYTTDANTLGRGVGASRIRVVGRGGVIVDSDSTTDAFAASGWSMSRRQ